MKRGGEVVRCCNELLHNSQSGINPAQLGIGPRNYARQLARYIRDPSTIRARTLGEWGRAPSISECREMIVEATAQRERYREESDRLSPKDIDAVDFVTGATQHALRVHRAAMRRAENAVELPQAEPANDDVLPPRPLLVGEMIEAVCKAMKVSNVALFSASRDRWIMRARQVISWVLFKRGMSYPDIGRRLKRDHSSIINAVRRFETHADDEMRLVAEHFVGGN